MDGDHATAGEAPLLLARLDRIGALDRRAAPAEVLSELRCLLSEAERLLCPGADRGSGRRKEVVERLSPAQPRITAQQET